jgi:hypothetical protein
MTFKELILFLALSMMIALPLGLVNPFPMLTLRTHHTKLILAPITLAPLLSQIKAISVCVRL